MPYITQPQRVALMRLGRADNAGELNYLFTFIVNTYLMRNGLKYQTINDVVGALEGAKAEFYRRVVIPYEDTKVRTNGDVYDESLLSRPHDGDSTI